MPTSRKLPLKLHERLGNEAMTELLTLFGDLGAETRAGFEELREADARLERQLDAVVGEIADLKPLAPDVADLKHDVADLKHDVAGLKHDVADLKHDVADIRQDVAGLKQQIADLKPHIASVQAELIKWTFLFWLGTIGIVLLIIRFPG